MSGNKELVHFGPFQEFFAQGVKVGEIIHLAGQIAIDDNGAIVGEDMAGQVRQVYANIARALEGFGATMSDVVDEMYFVTDLAELGAHAAAIGAIRSEAYGTEVPEVTQSLVQVSGLWLPGASVEVRCVAVAQS